MKNFYLSFIVLTSLFVSVCAESLQAQTVTSTGTFEPITSNGIVYAKLTFTDVDNDGNFDAAFALSEPELKAYSDYSAVVVFYTDRITVRNGGSIPSVSGLENAIKPEAGKEYQVWIDVNVAAKSYTTWIQGPDMSTPVRIFADAGFRNTGITSIKRWSAYHGDEADVVTATGVEIVNSVGDVPTGIDEEIKDNIKVYPTVSNGTFNIELPDNESGSVSVMDLNGKVIYSVSNTHGEKQTVEVKEPGVYLVNIQCKGVYKTVKVISVK